MNRPSTLRLTGGGDGRRGESPALRVAFASSDMETVDQHFGSASAFVVYRVDAEGFSLLNLTRFDAADHDGNESKLPAKIDALAGCAAVFCRAVGGSAVRQLLAAGVRPIKVEAGASIGGALGLLRAEVGRATTPWVVKALRAGDASRAGRFDRMEDAGWDG